MLIEMFELFVPPNFFSTMPAYQGSHRRPFLRLRISPLLGGISLYQEVVSVWVGAEKLPYLQHHALSQIIDYGELAMMVTGISMKYEKKRRRFLQQNGVDKYR